MERYIISSKADNDLDNITDYTLEVWGETQTRDYVTNEPAEKGIFIVRFLGQRQDFERHL